MRMLVSLRRSLGLTAARFHWRRSPDTVISFRNAISGASHILVVMPLDGSPSAPSDVVLTTLRHMIGEENITVLTAGSAEEVHRVLPRCHVMKLRPEEVSAVFLPRSDLVNRVTRRRYDAAVDLNLAFHLPSGYICRESRARVRVGFVGKQAEPFYNFQMHAGVKESPAASYERLARCLQMF